VYNPEKIFMAVLRIIKLVKKPIKLLSQGLLLHLGFGYDASYTFAICIANVEKNIGRDWKKYIGRVYQQYVNFGIPYSLCMYRENTRQCRQTI
jgi:hypothetical protein